MSIKQHESPAFKLSSKIEIRAINITNSDSHNDTTKLDVTIRNVSKIFGSKKQTFAAIGFVGK